MKPLGKTIKMSNSKYRHLIDGKTTEELITILNESEKYETEYIDDICQELKQRNIPASSLAMFTALINNKRNKEDTPKNTYPLYYAYIIFLFIGGIYELFTGFRIHTLIDNSIFLVNSICTSLVFIYATYLLYKKKSNAIFFAKFICCSVVIQYLLLMETLISTGTLSITRFAISILFCFYFFFSKNVNEIIPKEKRTYSTTDLIIIITISILQFYVVTIFRNAI